MPIVSSLIIPDLFKFDTFFEFLTEFISVNKSTHKFFSHRWLARKLDWPVSFCAELLSKRKSVTVSRAMELAAFLNLDSLQTERLILLVFADSPSDSVKNFALKMNSMYHIRPENEHTSVAKIVSDVDLFLLMELVDYWIDSELKGSFSRKIKNICPSLQLSEVDIFSKLMTLHEQGHIVLGPDGSISRGEKKHGLIARGTAAEFRKVHRQYGEYFLRHLTFSNDQSPAFGGFFRFPEDRLLEVSNKFEHLYHWLINVCQEYEAELKTTKTAENEQIYQFMFYMLPILQKQQQTEE